MLYDVAIIGGSYAGLSAAMPLVRARKNVIVIDAGERRNRFSEHSHGFLTQDGTPASEIVSQAKEQLQKYSTFEWQTGLVKRIETVADEFYICVDQLRSIQAKRIIIASGVQISFLIFKVWLNDGGNQCFIVRIAMVMS